MFRRSSATAATCRLILKHSAILCTARLAVARITIPCVSQCRLTLNAIADSNCRISVLVAAGVRNLQLFSAQLSRLGKGSLLLSSGQLANCRDKDTPPLLAGPSMPPGCL
ncbi:hypothetical protein BKA66DRAFT_460 [Pyrenochaeta sp. MPI-SDFR-AT-0127]|nr:hypothetical protein BKA66DRAFT_460 [Pyrenochaeta sp. MPI-SDFR-AT-0127]